MAFCLQKLTVHTSTISRVHMSIHMTGHTHMLQLAGHTKNDYCILYIEVWPNKLFP